VLRDFILFGYIIGWRKKAISTLTWNDVEGDTIRLRSRNSKNRNPYHIPFDIHPELAALIDRRKKARVVKTATGTTLSNLVFHRDGDPIYELRKAWETACMAVGLGKMICRACGHVGTKKAHCKKRCDYQGRIFHDLRRSAVRNMIRAGVDPKVAMRISGHETDYMLRRYDITSDDDLRHALSKMAKRREVERKRVVTL
jgi:integrase